MKNIDTVELEKSLESRKVAERIKGIKYIKVNRLTHFSEKLYRLYLNEKYKGTSWEIQCELIETLGLLGACEMLPEVLRIYENNLEFDLITNRAAGCLFRLTREDIHDFKPLRNLLPGSKYSVAYGILKTIGQDRRIYSNDDIEFLIDFINGWSYQIPKQYQDIRIGLANACAGWEKTQSVLSFLQQCCESQEPLKGVAAKALKGKYSDI